jgi:Methyltransferase domain
MSPGRFIRAVLGDRHARVAGRLYRAIFVDMKKASAAIAAELPSNARVLDVGGGDGEPLNYLLELRDDVRVTTIDVAPGVGRWIHAQHLDRVTRIESTSLQAYLDSGRPLPDVLLMSDVIHHVPVAARDAFLAVVAQVLQRAPHLRIIVKDVEPGHWRATLGRLSDLYVTGDRDVQLISRSDLVEAMRRAYAGIRHRETALFTIDPPNYAVVFSQ